MFPLKHALIRLRRGVSYAAVLGVALINRAQRHLLIEALDLARELPARLEQPLPVALLALTPPAQPQVLSFDATRAIVDALSAFGAGRPLGICLRRSLLRYHFLQRAGLPVVIHFGARRQGQDIAGHAWLTLNGQPYHEKAEHVWAHTVMWSYPAPEASQSALP
jgi:hypothetical protein